MDEEEEEEEDEREMEEDAYEDEFVVSAVEILFVVRDGISNKSV